MKTWKALLAIDNYHAISTYHIFKKNVRETKFSNTIFSSGFLKCVMEILWSQSRNRHNRKVRRTLFLNTVFLKSFLIWLTSQDTPYFSCQSKSVRTSSGVNGNKIQSFCGKYNSNLTSSSSPCQKFHDVLPIFSRRTFALSLWRSLLTTWKICWKVIQFIS